MRRRGRRWRLGRLRRRAGGYRRRRQQCRRDRVGRCWLRGRSTDRSGERRQGDIGYAVIRGGDIVGDHTVLFAGTGEQITLGHRATDRAIFARGAVRAALWLAAQPAWTLHYARFSWFKNKHLENTLRI